MIDLPLKPTQVQHFLRQCHQFNIMPMELTAYYPKHNDHPIANLLNRLVSECVGYLSASHEHEVNQLIAALPHALQRLTERPEPTEDQTFYLERVALAYLISVAYRHKVSFRGIVTAQLAESVVLGHYPDLLQHIDADGLLKLDSSLKFKFMFGVLRYGDHIIYCHQFLRRKYRGNANLTFLDRFARYYHASKQSNTFRIAIDHHRIVPIEHYHQILERDTWYGPHFDRAKLDDQHAVGLTLLKRSKPSFFDMFDDGLDATEVHWNYHRGVKTFESEEIVTQENTCDDYYFNRYVHSEWSTNDHVLRHCDGAVKIYLHDTYTKRLTSHMPTEFKSYKKIKLFRIDGDIDVDEWVKLVSTFYKGNELLIEYFNPTEFEEVFGEQIRLYRDARAGS